ncbi:hypothetical protein Tco_0735634 [Tanacetum coccineum]
MHQTLVPHPNNHNRVIPKQLLSQYQTPNSKKEEYDIWAIEMEHYLEYIDNEVWKVIQNGNSKKRISTGKDGVIRISWNGDGKRDREPSELRFGGLEKEYDRFQQLLSQLEAHGAEVSTEDANHKFLRSLPSAWGRMMERRRETLSINIRCGSKRRINGIADKRMMGLSIGENILKLKKQIMHLWLSAQAMSGDYTPKPQEEIDDALYVYGKKGPQKPEISVSDENSSEHSTCQSNDSEGSCENTSEHSFETESESLDEPNEMSKSRLEVTNEKDVSAPNSKEVAPSCVSHIKSPRQPLKDNETHKVNRKSWNDMMKRELGEGYSFTKKKCFVCGSLNHLIKDCDYYEKKIAREAEVKRVVNTGNGVTKPVWTNANRINHSNNFVPRSVQLNTGRPKVNSVRPNINTGRTNISSGNALKF